MGTRIGTPPDYFSSRNRDRRVNPRRNQARGKADRALAFLIVICGLCTLLVPLITVKPPVAHLARWSPMAVVVEMYRGNLPSPDCERCGEPLIRSLVALPFELTMIYLLALGSLIPLSSRNGSRGLTVMAGLGALLSLGLGGLANGLATRSEFHRTFYGSMGGRGEVHYGGLQLALFIVMAGLCVVSLPRESTDGV